MSEEMIKHDGDIFRIVVGGESLEDGDIYDCGNDALGSQYRVTGQAGDIVGQDLMAGPYYRKMNTVRLSAGDIVQPTDLVLDEGVWRGVRRHGNKLKEWETDICEYYREVDDTVATHEYDGWLWRKLEDGETIQVGDRWEGCDGGWRTQSASNGSVGRAFTGDVHCQMYRNIGQASAKPQKTVRIAYYVTEEYARAQAREKTGRNDNITARFDACREAVGDLVADAKREELEERVDAAEVSAREAQSNLDSIRRQLEEL